MKDERRKYKYKLSIVVLAFNKLDYTRLCIDNLMKYVSHFDFELITVNNGSTDGTADYFNSLLNEKKLYFPENMGCDLAITEAFNLAEGQFILFVSNDIVFTENAVDNLIYCIESDPRIGMAVPVCNYSSYNQVVEADYKTFEDMQEFARKYNVSAPRKWEDRLRLITYTFLCRSNLVKDMWKHNWIYSPGGFDDNDLSFRMRRAGYRLILAKDTYVHHFGSITMNRDYQEDNLLLDRNRKIFSDRFHVDAWDDTVISWDIVNSADTNRKGRQCILGIDTRCGATVMQIKNAFRAAGADDVDLFAFTEDERYLEDLNTFCVLAGTGKIQDLNNTFTGMSFDIIFLEKPLEEYDNMLELLRSLRLLMKPDGQLVFIIKNRCFYLRVYDLISNFEPIGGKVTETFLYKFMFAKQLQYLGYNKPDITGRKSLLPEEHTKLIKDIAACSSYEDKDEAYGIYSVRNFVFSIKGKDTFRKVLLYPGYDLWLDDKIFSICREKGQNAFMEEFRKKGFDIMTIDRGIYCFEDCEYIIFFDAPKRSGNLLFHDSFHEFYRGGELMKECWRKGFSAKMVLVIFDPPAICPENYDRVIHNFFGCIMTGDRTQADCNKYCVLKSIACTDEVESVDEYLKYCLKHKFLDRAAASSISDILSAWERR